MKPLKTGSYTHRPRCVCVCMYVYSPTNYRYVCSPRSCLVNTKRMKVTREAAGKKAVRVDAEFAGADLCMHMQEKV